MRRRKPSAVAPAVEDILLLEEPVDIEWGKLLGNDSMSIAANKIDEVKSPTPVTYGEDNSKDFVHQKTIYVKSVPESSPFQVSEDKEYKSHVASLLVSPGKSDVYSSDDVRRNNFELNSNYNTDQRVSFNNPNKLGAFHSPNKNEEDFRRSSLQYKQINSSHPRKVSVQHNYHDDLITLSGEMRVLFSSVKDQIIKFKEKQTELEKTICNNGTETTELESKIEELQYQNSQLQVNAIKGAQKKTQGNYRSQTLAQIDRQDKNMQWKLMSENRGNEIRQALLQSEDGEMGMAGEFEDQSRLERIRKGVRIWIRKQTPFEVDNQRIHAYFGGAVAAYFLFLRWM